MMHKSVPVSPIEFVQMESSDFSPLISRCTIKVCYVSDEPNRNKSIITKEVAKKLAPSLRGNPIIGHFNEEQEDFEQHNRAISITNGKFKVTSNTRPYGFVDLGAKVWFQKFLDDDSVEREYLVTEGYLWTKKYPECQRAISKGNNHSMELDEETLNAEWTKDNKGNYQFFIINEAITEALCILGEKEEPCFEGASIKGPEVDFSLSEESFKMQLFSMMNDIKELLNKGGEKVVTKYDVTIGDNVWTSLFNYLKSTYPNNESGSVYSISGFYTKEEQNYAVIKNKTDNKYYRINFSLTEESGFEIGNVLTEVTSTYEDDQQFDATEVENFEKSFTEEGKVVEENNTNSDNSTEEVCEKCGKNKNECSCQEDPKVTPEEPEVNSYNLEEIAEYVELRTKYSALESNYNTLIQERDTLKAENATLITFKAEVEKKDKEAMIQSFYMLSDEDKADVIANIDKYSVEDIEAKLAIICVRNKVNFKEEENNSSNNPTTYILENTEDEAVPAWVKRALEVAKKM